MLNKKLLLTFLLGTSISTSACAITLNDSLQLALLHDLSYINAYSKLQVTTNQSNDSYSNLLPTVGLTYKWNLKRDLSLPKDKAQFIDSSLTLGLKQSIFDYSNYLKLDIAKKQKAQAEITYLSAKQDLIKEVITGYINILKANSHINIDLKQINYLQKLVKDTDLRYKKGLASSVDYDLIQSKLSSAQAKLLGDQALLIKNINDYKVVVGDKADLSSLVGIGNVLPKLTFNSNFIVADLNNNLTLKSLAFTKVIAEHAISIGKSSYLPKVDLELGLSNSPKNNLAYGGISVRGLQSLDKFYLGVSVTIPLFTGGKVYNGIQISKAQYNQASTGYNLVYQKLNSASQSNLIAIKANKSIINSYQIGIDTTQKAFNSKSVAYKYGLASLTDVFDTSTQLYELEQKLNDAKYNYLLAIVQQKLLVGTLTEEDVHILNNAFNNKVNIKLDAIN